MKQSLHLRRGLEPLVTGISHPVRIINILPGIQTNQQIVRLGILLVQEMHVIRGDHLDAQPFAHLQNLGITPHLIIVHLRPLFRRFCRVTHHLQIIILPHQILVPQGRFISPLDISRHNLLANLPSQASG